MAVTLGSTGITFPDATTQTTAASAGGTRTFTTTGSVASAGLPVALNSDGTVSTTSSVSGAVTVANIKTGLASMSATQANTTTIYNTTSSHYFVVYRTGGNATCVAGTLSGSTFTWGTALNLGSGSAISAAWDSTNNKYVVVYRDGSQNFVSVVVSVSGTTCSAGSIVTISADGNTQQGTMCSFDPVSGKIAALRIYDSTNYYWGAWVGTVSGTTVSWAGETTVFGSTTNPAPTNYPNSYSIKTINNGSMVISSLTNTLGAAKVQSFTISGTSITAGDTQQFTLPTGASTLTITPYISAGVWVVSVLGSSAVYTTLFSVSGTIVSAVYGYSSTAWTSQISNISNTDQISSTYDSTADRIVIFAYWNNSLTAMMGQITTITVASLSFPTANFVTVGNSSTQIHQNASTWSSGAGKTVVAYPLSNTVLNSGLLTTPYSTNQNFIGLSTASAAGGASLSCTIIGGVNTNVSGLTTNSIYYASPTGTLTTSNLGVGKVGRALSATSILVTGGSS